MPEEPFVSDHVVSNGVDRSTSLRIIYRFRIQNQNISVVS